jgi:hypothetical protein
MAGRTIMRTAILLLVCALALAGCGRPTTGAEIDRMMAEARSDAATDLARSRDDMRTDRSGGYDFNRRQRVGGGIAVATAPVAADRAVTEMTYARSLDRAQANYWLAFERCRVASGPTRLACKMAADAALDAENANAAQLRDEQLHDTV